MRMNIFFMKFSWHQVEKNGRDGEVLLYLYKGTKIMGAP